MFTKSTRSSLFIFLFFSLFVCLMGGCEDNTSSESPISKGEVIGLIQPMDQWDRPVAEKNGIQVKLQGTNITDTTTRSGNYGRYKLTGVEAGTYTITLTKEGYGTMKIPFYDFFGNGQDFVSNGLPAELGKIPEYNVQLDSVFVRESFDGKKIIVNGSLSAIAPPNGRASVVVYVSDSPDINPNDASTYLAIAASISLPGVERYTGTFNHSDFKPGTKLYFRSYPISSTTLFYVDPSGKTNKFVYCCIGTPTETKSMTVSDSSSNQMRSKYTRRTFSVTINSKNETSVKYFKKPRKKIPAAVSKLRKQISNIKKIK